MIQKLLNNKITYQVLFITITVIIIAIEGIFINYTNKSKEIQKNILLETSQIHFKHIVNTRAWNAHFGGVYVKPTDGMKPNPYLDDNHIFAKENTMLLKINPAWMTRMLSEIQSNDKFNFRITSLNPINPINKPNKFQKEALEFIENNKSQDEFYQLNTKNNKFNYLAKLTVKNSCMKCHAKQGYKIGDIRGGISVEINAKENIEAMEFFGFLKYASIIISIIFVIITFYILLYIYKFNHSITMQNIKLDQKVKQRTKELELAYEEANRANNQKSDFLNNVTHELITPLNGIIATSSLAIEKNKDSQIDQNLMLIKYSANTLYTLVKNILSFSKLEKGELKVESKLFNKISIVEKVIELTQQKAKTKNIEIEIFIDSNIPNNLYGDEEKIIQVLFQLVDNAIKFTKDGIVKLSINLTNKTDKNSELLFAVEDSGIGIDKENQEEILNRLGQLDSKKNRKYEGMGIGLLFSNKMVNLLGGKLSIESELGKGTIVSFSLLLKNSNVQDSFNFEENKKDTPNIITKDVSKKIDIDKSTKMLKQVLLGIEKDYSEAIDISNELKKLASSTIIYEDINDIDLTLNQFNTNEVKVKIEKLIKKINKEEFYR